VDRLAGAVTSRRPRGTSHPKVVIVRLAKEGRVMATSGVEEVAWRFLGAFYDLSGHSPLRPVPIGTPDSPPNESAAKTAGVEPGSTECDVALRYLLNGGYVKETDTPSEYEITVRGIEKVRGMRGLADPASSEGGNKMSDQTQRRLLTGLSIGIAMVLTRPVNRYIAEQIPERRGIMDDLTEAALQGLVRAAAFFVASLVVRQIAGSR
jgi:hypothetical protein